LSYIELNIRFAKPVISSHFSAIYLWLLINFGPTFVLSFCENLNLEKTTTLCFCHCIICSSVNCVALSLKLKQRCFYLLLDLTAHWRITQYWPYLFMYNYKLTLICDIYTPTEKIRLIIFTRECFKLHLNILFEINQANAYLNNWSDWNVD
jgi:hypothetical protein